jgi:transcriptional regulator with XRE-family HTH domain
VSSPVSPVVAGWELALRLRQRRQQLGIEVRTITQELGFSRNYWSAVENERKILSEASLAKLLELFELDPDERQELLRLRAIAKEHGWWTSYSAVLDDEVQRLVGLESGAYSVRAWESLLIPGLLQTPDYARALMTPDVNLRQVEVEQRVEARMRRRERLTGDSPLRLTALISEAALRQEIGGRAVLRGQLVHVGEMTEQHPDTIEVRVIPFSTPACGLFGAATVHLIDFESSRLPTVIWQETVTSWGVVDDPMKVRDISGTYREALVRALSGRDSSQLIHECIKELA